MKDWKETIGEQLKPYIISKYGKVYLNGEMRIEGLLLVIDSLLSQQRKEVLEALEEKEILDDGALYSTEYKNGFNDALEQIKYLINKQ